MSMLCWPESSTGSMISIGDSSKAFIISERSNRSCYRLLTWTANHRVLLSTSNCNTRQWRWSCGSQSRGIILEVTFLVGLTFFGIIYEYLRDS